MFVPAMRTTSVFGRVLRSFLSGKRLIVLQGGTRSSKTFSALQALILIAITYHVQLVISVVAESVPHLKRGAIRDFEKIMGDTFDPEEFNKSDHVYPFGKSIIEFFSADCASKLRGGTRDILFLNEANNNTKEIFDELDVRTTICTIVDYNPTSHFWLHDILITKGITDFTKDSEVGDTVFIHSTYQDAKDVLPLSVVNNIESRRNTDPNWWRVYGLGLVGKIEGLIHPNFTTLPDLPEEGVEGYGLDFGYTDPAALCRNKIIGNTLYSDELLYESGLTNQDLDRKLLELGLVKGLSEIVADSAEPKSIEELKRMGWNIKPSIKASVKVGAQKVNQYKQVWTDRSTNGIKEQRNYMWDKNNEGKILETDLKSAFNHLMAARRYWVVNKTLGLKKIFDFCIGDEKKFTVNWEDASEDILNYGALVQTDNNTVYFLAVLWDRVGEKLYVYGANCFESVIPNKMSFEMIKTMKLKMVVASRIFINDNLSGKNIRNTSSLIKQALASDGVDINMIEPPLYDFYGSIVYINALFNSKRIFVHCDIPTVAAQLDGWSYAENGKKQEGYGYCEGLCMIASELKKELSAKSEQPAVVDYKPVIKKSEPKEKWQTA